MFLKHTYSVVTELHVFEKWPIIAGKFRVEFSENDELVTSISVRARLETTAQLPSIQLTPEKRTKARLDLGRSQAEEEIRALLFTVQGIMNLFIPFSIDFSNVRIDWEPETEEEKQQLKVFSFSVNQQRVKDTPRYLGFDLIARTAFKAPAASYFEVPLSFLRRCMQDMRAGRYIEAFYSAFFFLETLYAPGYSNPNVVRQKLLSASPIIDALNEIRKERANSWPAGLAAKVKSLLSESDEDLIFYLVSVRGNLHHHALERRDAWHPERAGEYEAEATVLREIVHSIAMKEVFSVLYSSEQDDAFIAATREVGATVTLKADVQILDSGKLANLKPIEMQFPGTKVYLGMIGRAHLELRKLLSSQRSARNIAGYKITSSDGKNVFATYTRA